MEEGKLIESTDKEIQANDDFISALSTVAYAGLDIDELEIVDDTKPKSRFFFQVSESISQHVKKRAVKMKPKKLQHIDQVITDRLKTYKKEVPAELTNNIEQVREFFLKTIGPLTLAGGPGTIQARDVVQRLLNSEVDGQLFAKFDRMSEAAVTMVMAKFIAKYYRLPRTAEQAIIDSIAPRQPMVVPIPYPEPRNVPNRRNTKEGKKPNPAK